MYYKIENKKVIFEFFMLLHLAFWNILLTNVCKDV